MPDAPQLPPGVQWCAKHGLGGTFRGWTCRRCSEEGASEPPAPLPSPKPAWSAAKRSECPQGHKHRSRLEARVCARLTEECAANGDALFQNIRLPLISISPKPETGAPMVITVDFAIVRGGRLHRLVDAKSSRKSRDWDRGARACESSWGVKIEESSE